LGLYDWFGDFYSWVFILTIVNFFILAEKRRLPKPGSILKINLTIIIAFLDSVSISCIG